MLARFIFREALCHQSRAQEPANPYSGGARTGEQEALISQRAAGKCQTGKDTCKSHGGSALNIVIEAGQTPGVSAQQSESVGFLEILPLQQGAGKHMSNGLDKFFDERVIFGTSQPTASVTEIVWVLEQGTIVGSYVQADRQAKGRMNSGPG
jgi:hypothetical protein